VREIEAARSLNPRELLQLAATLRRFPPQESLAVHLATVAFETIA